MTSASAAFAEPFRRYRLSRASSILRGDRGFESPSLQQRVRLTSPDPDRDEVAMRVTAISLNHGETRRAVQQAEPGWRPGWDFAGVAETAAGDGLQIAAVRLGKKLWTNDRRAGRG